MVAGEYKQTDIGEIPKDWSVSSMGEVGENISGLTYSPNDVSEYGTLVLRSSNIQNNRLAYDNNVFVNMDLPKRVIVEENDLLICVRNGSKRLIGKCTLIDEKVAGNAFGAFMSVYRSNYNKFIFQMFQSNIILKQIDETMGATINQLTNKDLSGFKIPIPPKQEQKAIATALSDVDGLISSLETLIVKKEDIKTATMQQLLTGNKRLDGFSGELKQVTIGRDCTLKARIGWQGLTVGEYKDTGNYFLVTGTDFNNGLVDWDTCHYVDKWRYTQDKNIQLKVGDVLITKDGTIGKVGYVENLVLPATLNSGVFVVRPKHGEIFSKYLYYIFASEIFEEFLNRLTAGSTINHLYQKDFVYFNFKIPEFLEQEAIAIVLTDMDKELESLKNRLEKTKTIKKGMMQELLTGKTRLLEVEVS